MKGCLTVIGGVFFLFVLFVLITPSPDSSSSPQQKEADKNKGFHCLSDWDGSHSGLKNSVKSVLRNPSSFEHIETKIGPVNENGQHFVSMRYRAENGFGGTNIEFATATISNISCQLIDWSSN